MSTTFLDKASKFLIKGQKAIDDLAEQKYKMAVRNLDLSERRDNLKIRQYNNGARVQIAQLEAQGQVNKAQNLSALGIGSFADADIGSAQTIKGSSNAVNDNAILYLTIAGIAFAALTYFKGH